MHFALCLSYLVHKYITWSQNLGRLNPPTPFSLDGNVQENWRAWKQNFQIYLVATESDEKTDKVKANLLLHVIGDAAKQVYNTFTFAVEGDSLKLDKI